MPENKRGKLINHYVQDYVLFDLETTGISCVYDDVIEISAVKVRDGKIIDEFSRLVNPGRPIPQAASAVNHITDDMVENEPAIYKILPEFDRFIGDHILVGHNIQSFDMRFIYRDYEKHMGTIPGNDYVDTLKLARILLPQLRHHRLGDLAQFYGFSTEGAHRALADCRMNQKVFECLGKAISACGNGNTQMMFAGHGQKICPKCGSLLQKRNGRYGEFWGCSGYPMCRHTENV